MDTFKTIWKMCLKRRKNLIQGFIFNFLRNLVGVTQVVSIIIAINTLLNPVNITKSIIWIIVLTVVCIVGTYATSYVEQNATGDAGFYMTADKRREIGGFLRKLPLGFFNNSTTTKITATLTTTLSGIESASLFTMIGIVSGFFSCICLVLCMLFYNLQVALITTIGVLVYLLVLFLQIKVSRKNAPKLVKTQTSLSDKALTYLKGIKVTKAFSFKEGDKDINNIIEESSKQNISLTNKSMPTQFLASLTVKIFESFIFLYTLYSFVVTKNIEIADFIVLIIFSFFAFASLNQAGSMLSMIGLLDSGLREVLDIEKNKTMETKTPILKSEGNDIEFNNVSFSFGKNEVLSNINLNIKPNTLTAIIGPSGSGKTTLCNLIPRFYDVNRGEIKIGGVNVKNIDSDELMKKISMVFQDVYLFEDSILNNIRFGKPDASLEEVIEVSKKACCHDFITSLPEGYDTVLSEGGSSLSGGEKQRISIARAMLKDSPIVILDEATSSLDAENEKEILSAIDSLIDGKTVIMIAHRIKTVEHADNIIALKEGKVVQIGNHNELINEEGLYKDFIKAREEASGWTIEN